LGVVRDVRLVDLAAGMENWKGGGMTMLELSLEVDRRLNRLGWDRTVNGWEHSRTREVASMESALRMEAMKEEREKAGEGEA